VTLVFICSVFVLYIMHETDWDRLDVEDIQMLYPLVVDDVDPLRPDVENPNRIFKAVTVTTSRTGYCLSIFFHVVCLLLAAFAWLILEEYWRFASEGTVNDDFRKSTVDMVVKNEEDAMAMAMQLTVGCLMYILQTIFEYMHWRETAAVMPSTKEGGIWDPRRHGIPSKFWLLGMPSMWFTSEHAYKRCKRYIAMVNLGTEHVFRIYPQELAYYSLTGDDCRNELTQALSEAKKFDPYKQSFILDGSGDIESLDIDLCFYDSKLKHSKFPHPGEFQYFKMEEEDSVEMSATKSVRQSHMVVQREKVYSRKSNTKDSID